MEVTIHMDVTRQRILSFNDKDSQPLGGWVNACLLSLALPTPPQPELVMSY